MNFKINYNRYYNAKLNNIHWEACNNKYLKFKYRVIFNLYAQGKGSDWSSPL